MKIETRDFGSIEIDENDIITFRQPIYGFEHLTKYVILYDNEMQENFVWFQSLEDSEICFIMVDPDILDVEYRPIFPESISKLLGEEDDICWCIVTIPQDFEKATANLKSPVLVNPIQKCAAQIILEGNYPIRQPLVSSNKDGEGKKSC